MDPQSQTPKRPRARRRKSKPSAGGERIGESTMTRNVARDKPLKKVLAPVEKPAQDGERSSLRSILRRGIEASWQHASA